jgi:predicted nucleic acid-binding protein
MASSVFMDTSGWYALIDRNDAAHGRTAAVVAQLVRDGARLVTSDYVLDESYTLARARSGTVMAFRLLDLVHETAALDIEWVGSERFEAAERQFRKYHDQAFSFTDFTSFVIMREHRIREAITTDEHFRIAGFVLLPDPGTASSASRKGRS